ncbi:MAG: DUF4235 domain-containing protein [Solirubrobacteraceae bacterium]
MTILYKPIGIALGLAAASLGRLIFGKVWGLVADEEPPEPTTQETSWPKLLLVAAIQGVIFRMTRVAVDRWGAIGWHQLTGTWPGEKRPDPA